MVVDVARGPRLLDPRRVHHDDLVGDVHRLLLVVRDEDGCCELFVTAIGCPITIVEVGRTRSTGEPVRAPPVIPTLAVGWIP